MSSVAFWSALRRRGMKAVVVVVAAAGLAVVPLDARPALAEPVCTAEASNPFGDHLGRDVAAADSQPSAGQPHGELTLAAADLVRLAGAREGHERLQAIEEPVDQPPLDRVSGPVLVVDVAARGRARGRGGTQTPTSLRSLSAAASNGRSLGRARSASRASPVAS